VSALQQVGVSIQCNFVSLGHYKIYVENLQEAMYPLGIGIPLGGGCTCMVNKICDEDLMKICVSCWGRL
jgi:hypothetical protein